MKYVTLLVSVGILSTASAQDGIRNPSFGENGAQFVNISTIWIGNPGQDDYCEDLVQQASGRIILGGYYHSAAGGTSYDWTLAGLTATGILDSTFGTNGIVRISPGASQQNSLGLALAVDPNTQNIYMGGTGKVNNWDPRSTTLMRFRIDGAVDTSFGINGRMIEQAIGTSEASDIALQATGRVVVVGTAFANYPMCARYLQNGDRDQSFGADTLAGVVTLPMTGRFNALAIDPVDGSIVAVGTNGDEVLVARLTVDGLLDTTFNGTGWASFDPNGTALTSTAADVALDAYRRPVITGRANNEDHFLVMRTKYNGQLDTTFNGTGVLLLVPAGQDGIGYSVVVQPDCRIVVAGDDQSATHGHVLFRLLPNGDLDPSFGTGGIVTDSLPSPETGGGWRALELSATGTLLAAGVGHESDWWTPDLAIAEYSTSMDLSTDCAAPVNTGISSPLPEATGLQVWPNPAHDVLHVAGPRTALGGTITLFDAQGRSIRNWTLTDTPQAFMVGDISPGFYHIISAGGAGSFSVSRFIKE